MADATTFETVLMQNKVDLVVSGRLGWNGRYWAHAPGVHEPCPGAGYQERPSDNAAALCGGGGTQTPDPQQAASARIVALSRTLSGLGAPPAPDPVGVSQQTGFASLPFVVAASAGGKFGPQGNDNGTAADGYWRGYSVVRISPTGEFAPIVEQRAVFDWIGIRGQAHVLRPGQKLALHGYGREPAGIDVPLRYDDIDSPAITHRYDLIEADPVKPWIPKVVEGNGQPHGYVALDPTVGTIDPQTGRVIAQRANHGRIFALAVLSVGQKAATFPISFEPKRSFVAPSSPRLSVPVVPSIRVLGFSASSLNTPTSTPPSSPPPPVNTTLNLPAPPALPSFPSATPLSLPPPAPPAPPAPPGGQAGTGLSLSINVTGVMVPPTTGVAAQPTPPVNPSPPGGARKEAKQHQASAAKSEEGGSQVKGAEGDLAQSREDPTGSAFTRRRPDPQVSAWAPMLKQRPQASAWTTGLQWGGSIGLMALVLALGFTTVRPTPRGRRRLPVVPAPAYVRQRRRW
jgi:hypothetical protein